MIIAIIVLYLLAMIGIGVAYRKRASTDTASYLVAGRSMGATIGGGAVASSYASTSSFLGSLGAMFTLGLAFGMWQNMGVIAGFAIAAIFIAPRFRQYMPLSFSEFFAKRYDNRVRFTAAAITVVAMFVYILIQLQGGAYAMTYVLGVNHQLGVIVIGLILLAYVGMGGSQSSKIASFIQFVMMMLAMLTVAGVALADRSWSETVSLTAEQNAIALELGGDFGLIAGVSVMLMMFLGVMSSPHLYLMFMWAKTTKIAQKSAALATTYLAVFYTVLFIVGAYIISTYPNLESPDMGYFEVLNHLPTILIGLFVAAVLAAAMSTADAQLLNATSAITNDLNQAFRKRPIRGDRAVLVNRIVMLIIGVLAIIVALDPPELIVWLLAIAQALMIGAFFAPIVLGLFWKKATSTAALLGMIAGFVVAIVVQFLPMPNEFIGGPIAGVVSLVTMVIITLAKPKTNNATTVTSPQLSTAND